MPAEVMKFAEKARAGIRAWWRKSEKDGHTLINPYASASEAYEQIGKYYPRLVDIPPLCIDGNDVPIDMKAIVRPPVPEDNGWTVFGVVTPKYNLLTPADSVELYDQHVRDADGNIVPVETIGALQRGKIFFISTELPETDVRGDRIRRYMLVTSPMDGISAAEVMLTDVRVVCMNTYRAAVNSSKERFTVQHHSKVKEHFGLWLSYLYSMITDKATVMQEAYNLMANTSVSSQDIDWIADSVYPVKSEPNEYDFPKEIYGLEYRKWERQNQLHMNCRAAFKELFNGGAIGAETEAFNGTAYGAFQSIVQIENQKGQMRGIDGRMNQIFFGDRGKTMQKAFVAAVKVAGRY